MQRAEMYMCMDGRGQEWQILTFPGCSRPEHFEEVEGAATALILRGVGWAGTTEMDCGCLLSIEPVDDDDL